jgi:hypothetical protein
VGAIVKRALPLVVALVVSAALVGAYAALGGGSYEPTPVADPCTVREWRNPDDLSSTLEQVVLSALDGAACTLHVSREDLVLALRDKESLEKFAKDHGVSTADAEEAVRHGLDRALDDADAAGALPGFVSSLARKAIEALEPWRLIDALESLRDLLP